MSDFDPRAGMGIMERHWFDHYKQVGKSDKKARAMSKKQAGLTSADRVAAGHSTKPGQQAKTDRLNAGIKAEKQSEAERLEREEWLETAGAVGRVTLIPKR